MNGFEYQNLAMRTNDGRSSQRLAGALELSMHNADDVDLGGVFNACLGLSGEVGELNDMIKKWIFHTHLIDMEHAKKELGDICWYIALMCQSMGWDLSEIMQMNINKLIARYPDGFSTDKSILRSEDDV